MRGIAFAVALIASLPAAFGATAAPAVPDLALLADLCDALPCLGAAAPAEEPAPRHGPFSFASADCSTLTDDDGKKPRRDPSTHACSVAASGLYSVGPCDETGCRFVAAGRVQGLVDEPLDVSLFLSAASYGAENSGDHDLCRVDDPGPAASAECHGVADLRAPVAAGECARFGLYAAFSAGSTERGVAAYTDGAFEVDVCNDGSVGPAPPVPNSFSARSDDCHWTRETDGAWTSGPSAHVCSSRASGAYAVGPCDADSCAFTAQGSTTGTVDEPMRMGVALIASLEGDEAYAQLCNAGTDEATTTFSCDGGATLDVPVVPGECRNVVLHSKAVAGEERADERNAWVPAVAWTFTTLAACSPADPPGPSSFGAESSDCRWAREEDGTWTGGTSAHACSSRADVTYTTGPCDEAGCTFTAQGSTDATVDAPMPMAVVLLASFGEGAHELCNVASPDARTAFGCSGAVSFVVPLGEGECRDVLVRSKGVAGEERADERNSWVPAVAGTATTVQVCRDAAGAPAG